MYTERPGQTRDTSYIQNIDNTTQWLVSAENEVDF
jgi:hypothetical protein